MAQSNYPNLIASRRTILKIMLVLTIFAFLPPLSNAAPGHIRLLAVTDVNSTALKGEVADLYLEVRPGRGGVYIDTFPLTRIDTQISTRFAKEYACRESEVDCESYDFFYTIKSGSTIVGGPSAGSAVAVLTIAMLKNWEVDKKTAMSGTINSGGIIGPVGGIKEKVDAAARNGITTILIPDGEKLIDDSNVTFDVDEYSKANGVKIIEVDNVRQAVYYFTGNKLDEPQGEINATPQYLNTMKKLAFDLCRRSEELFDDITMNRDLLNISDSEIQGMENLTANAKRNFNSERYYSSASMCFGANTKFGYYGLILKNYSADEIDQSIEDSNKLIVSLERKLDAQRLKTISDLEAYIIVKERLLEAQDILADARVSLAANKSLDALYNFAYATERINSANAWMNFFDLDSKEYRLDKESVRNSCITKIAEAEERYQYVRFFIPYALEETRVGIDRAYKDLNSNNYELCLFKASKAKAEADMVLGVFGVEKENVREVVVKKMTAVKNNLLLQQSKGFFPIVGYSYYEYAGTLSQNDPFSALLYAEYSLELSNIDLYFKQSKKTYLQEGGKEPKKFDLTYLFIFLLGFSIGAFLVMYLHSRRNEHEHGSSSGKRRR